MAYTFVGAGTPAESATVASIGVVAPTVAVGDFLLAVIINKALANVISAPAGWTSISQDQVDCTTGTEDFRYALFYRVAQSGDSGATFTFTKVTDDNVLFYGIIGAWRGADTTTPLDVTAVGVTKTTTANANVSFPAFDPTSTDAHVIYVACYSQDLTAFAAAMSNDVNPDCTTRWDVETPTTNDFSIACTSGDSNGAAIASRTWASGASATAGNVGIVFALQAPAAVAVPADSPSITYVFGTKRFSNRAAVQAGWFTSPFVALGAFTLPADPGSYALTGLPATLTATRVLSADPGSYAITGSDATFNVGLILPADPGNYTVTGSDATLSAARRLDADAGSYSIAGSDAALIGPAAPTTGDGTTTAVLVVPWHAPRTPRAAIQAGWYTSSPPEPIPDSSSATVVMWQQGPTRQAIRAVLAATRFASGVVVTPGAFSLPADPGAYAITGSPATFPVARLLTADPGAYAITGSPATFALTRFLTADPGLYTLTGAATTFGLTRFLTADPGLYTLTGAAAELTHVAGRLLAADPGTYTITGQAANLLVGHKLFADFGVYTITGSPAGLVVTLPATPGAYTIFGFDAALIYTQPAGFTFPADPGLYVLLGWDTGPPALARRLMADPGSYLLTGSPATLRYVSLSQRPVYLAAHGVEARWPLQGEISGRWELRVHFGARWDLAHLLGPFDQALVIRPSIHVLEAEDAGHYLITGYDATLVHGHPMLAVPGNYTITGYRVNHRLPANRGSYLITGSPAGSVTTRYIQLNAGAYAITGRTASLFKGSGINLDEGHYTLTGSDAVLRRQHAPFTAVPGTYTISGSPATLIKSKRMVAEAGSYALTGSDTTLRATRRVTVDPGIYTLTGQAASLLKGKRLDAVPGVYTLTGSPALFPLARRLTADIGHYTITGSDAGLFEFAGLLAIPGAYAINGSPADLRKATRFIAEMGHYTITGRRTDASLLVNGGSYAITGSAANLIWSGPVIGVQKIVGGYVTNNGSFPGSRMDLRADWLALVRPSDYKLVPKGPITGLTCDINQSGPSANGRDQVAGFSGPTWVHFYYIYNATTDTLATISSLTTPPAGPALPSGYEYWAYATSVLLKVGSTLARCSTFGSMVIYDEDSGQLKVLGAGSATSFTAVTITSVVPPVSRQAQAYFLLNANLSAGGLPQVVVAYVRQTGGTSPTGMPVCVANFITPGVGASVFDSSSQWVECDSQSLDYRVDYGSTFPVFVGLDIYIHGYRVPNGGE